VLIAKWILRRAGPAYPEALRNGLMADRIFVGDPHGLASGLGDVVEQIPSIAVFAFQGAAASCDVEGRASAAAALPSLYLRHPDQAIQLLQALSSDSEEQVVQVARESTNMIQWPGNGEAGL
jgi:hypothetical protein